MLQASCQLREAADASEGPNVAAEPSTLQPAPTDSGCGAA